MTFKWLEDPGQPEIPEEAEKAFKTLFEHMKKPPKTPIKKSQYSVPGVFGKDREFDLEEHPDVRVDGEGRFWIRLPDSTVGGIINAI